MKTEDDGALVARALEGQTAAFALLVQRHQSYAHGTALGLIADFELAKDVVQEAFLVAYLDLGKLKEPLRFRPWLCGIVRYTALAARREREKVHTLAAQLGVEWEQLVFQDTGGEERRQVLSRAMWILAEGDREILCLCYMNGLSYAEIAHHFDTNVTTVKGRLQRARTRLREAVEMVEKELAQEGLPEDFSAEVRQLLEGLENSKEGREQTVGRFAQMGEDAVGPLADALEDERVWVRHVAVRALCVLGDGRALKPLLRLLYRRGGLPHLHEGEVLAVPGMREALLELVKRRAWNEDNRDDRQNWARFFALSAAEGDEEVFDCIVAVFRDGDQHWSIRYFALRALVKIKPGAAIGLVIEGLAAAEAPLVDRALRIGARLGLELPLSAYQLVLERSDWPCFPRLLDKVLGFGQAGIELVERKAASDKLTERVVALQGLAGIGVESAGSRLAEGLLAGPEKMQDVDIWSDPFAVRDLLWQSKKEHSAVGPLVEGYLQVGMPGSRVAAILLLARQRGAELAPQLRRILAGTSRCRGKVARRAFWEMHRLGPAALPTVLAMLESGNWRERKAAVCLLKRWGKLTPEDRARALDDDHIAVRNTVKDDG